MTGCHVEPLNQGAQVGSQLVRMGFIAPKRFQRGFEEAILTTSTGIGQTRFELLAPGASATGDTMPERR
ncbi:hypothetical protein [Paraburkholderia sp. JPY465]|uniref:hypothetical protein n=1 Tax=Paraburkholderia sp. JPY465 TaxID=3042285 RepID=UPI003D1B22DB